MVEVIERSPEMVRLVYFLHEYARTSDSGRSKPPEEFGDLTWRDVYEQFYTKLGEGRSFDTFKGSAEGLRKGNIREHKESGTPFLPKYDTILRTWIMKSREQQWSDLQSFRTV